MRKAMTPEQAAAHEAWLADMNHHSAIGGKTQFLNWDKKWETCREAFPSWSSDPDKWRKVPLPRTAKVFIAYNWVSGGFYSTTIHQSEIDEYKELGYSIQQITVTEELP